MLRRQRAKGIDDHGDTIGRFDPFHAKPLESVHLSEIGELILTRKNVRVRW
jgi:hypothetical protein